ncbi:hypothetical protein HPB47_027531 [Ixodes persulcatus]|uniref:Uncharacterized protein n=1 Tax=Ixodes persulcatus TaxID=34615 RepID=A0AC60PX15_IXOPE|nr:hypothetical protein HPB47_027531 [Ixodes persulcatus]
MDVIEVEGEDISPETLQEPEWLTVNERKKKKKEESRRWGCHESRQRSDDATTKERLARTPAGKSATTATAAGRGPQGGATGMTSQLGACSHRRLVVSEYSLAQPDSTAQKRRHG